MDVLYPNLHDRFKNEGLCPICMMEMQFTPRHSCINGHVVCHRCKPYYYSCPTCRAPLDIEIPPAEVNPPYPPANVHVMPQPYPRHGRNPSAPPMDDFLAHERQAWGPPPPSEDQELNSCSYHHLGCWVKLPEHLRVLHESRCQFRPHLEDEHLPTDLNQNPEDVIQCPYYVVGCNVRTAAWRIPTHQNHCIYKDRFESMNNISEGMGSVSIDDHDDSYGDPEELVECKYRRYGCKVNMKRRRKYMHEEKCNYNKHNQEEDDQESSSDNEEYGDPDEQLPCRWNEYGCRVQPKRSRIEMHEEKCNYRRIECVYGCGAMIQPAAKFAHERSCSLAN